MSLFKKSVYTVLSSLLFFGLATPLTYAEGTAATVGLTYQKYSDLTPQQQSQVIKSTPNEEIVQEHVSYILVYAPCSSNKAIGVLPNTGDTLTTVTVAIVGISAVILSGYLVYRNKKSGTVLIVILASTSLLNTEASISADANRHFGDTVYQTSSIGTTFTYDPEQKVEGLCYVGYIVSQNKQDETTTTQLTDEATTTTTATLTTTVSAITTIEHESSDTTTSLVTDTSTAYLPGPYPPEKLIEFLKNKTLSEAEEYIDLLRRLRQFSSIEQVNYFREAIGLPPIVEETTVETTFTVEPNE